MGLGKNQKYMIHNEGKNQSNKSVSQVIQMMELVDKDIKITIIMVFHISQKLEEESKMFCRDMKGIKNPNPVSRDEISDV